MQAPLKLKVGKVSGQSPERAPEGEPVRKLAIVSRGAVGKSEGRLADGTFRALVIACAVALLVIVVLIVVQLVRQSSLSTHKFGLKFLTSSMWNPVTGQF